MSQTRLVLIVALALAACAQQPAPEPSAPVAPADSSANLVPDQAPTVQAGKAEILDPRVAYFEVDPALVHACEGRDRITSEARWKINDPAVTTVELQVNTPDDLKRKTFATEPGTGVAHTEQWVVANMSFYLVEQSSGKDLAHLVIASQPCK